MLWQWGVWNVSVIVQLLQLQSKMLALLWDDEDLCLCRRDCRRASRTCVHTLIMLTTYHCSSLCSQTARLTVSLHSLILCNYLHWGHVFTPVCLSLCPLGCSSLCSQIAHLTVSLHSLILCNYLHWVCVFTSVCLSVDNVPLLVCAGHEM